MMETGFVPDAENWDCSLSPTGTHAALTWSSWPDTQGGSGIAVAVYGAHGWVTPLGAAISGILVQGTMPDDCLESSGWSGSGRFFGSLHMAGDGSCWAVRFFDTASMTWLPQRQLPDSEEWEPMWDMEFCADETLAAVQVEHCGILVCGVQQHSVSILIVPDPVLLPLCMAWFPDSHSLMMLDDIDQALAVTALDSSPEGLTTFLDPEWVFDPVSASASLHVDAAAMGILPGGAIVVVYIKRWSRSRQAGFHFIVYDQDLHRVSEQDLTAARDIPRDKKKLAVVHHTITVAQHALAVRCWSVGTYVFALQGPSAVGRHLFTAPNLGFVAFSPDGHFLAGTYGLTDGSADPLPGDAFHVLDGRTGTCLVRLRLASSWPGMPAERIRRKLAIQVMWADRQLVAISRVDMRDTTGLCKRHLHSVLSF